MQSYHTMEMLSLLPSEHKPHKLTVPLFTRPFLTQILTMTGGTGSSRKEATVLLLLLLTTNMSTISAEQKVTVLAFGGNGFIGSEVVSRMIDRNYEVILVSRGNWYFDSEDRIKPFVIPVVCDREAGIQLCDELMELINKTERFDYVLDFSGYTPRVVAKALKVLGSKIGVYMYISTDSVYEVCEPPKVRGSTAENDAVRPTNAEDRVRMNEVDTYGNEKLEGEEVLLHHREKHGLNYLVFRLPDVFGPRDTTARWWMYQLWIQFYEFIQVPLYVPPEIATLRTSLVHVKDVAEAVVLALDKGPAVWNTAYNLGFDRDFTLEEFLSDLAEAVDVDIEFDNSQNELSFYHYPTVERGPLNITKAKQVLGFKPTDWKDALQETVEFNQEAFHLFKKERDEVIDELIHDVVPPEMEQKFLDLIDRIEDASLQSAKDEL